MKTKFRLLNFVVLLLAMSTTARAARYTVNGYVRDSTSSENLIGAAIYVPSSKLGTSANQYGFFSITLPEGEVQLTFSYVGYLPQTRTFWLRSDTTFSIKLISGYVLEEVIVTADKSAPIHERTQMSALHVPVAQVKSIPAFLGEVDILKALQLLPGVQSGGEGSSGLYVRGGGPDQNLILLDGVPVYNASHLFGFFSVFNADAINNIELIKGGFPARYGGRVSSVVDINMKEGNAQEYHAEGSVGVVAAKLTLEGPIIKNRTSFIVSARRTYIDAIIAPFLAAYNNSESNISAGYYFYDLNAKVNHRFSERDRLYLSAYLGNDKFYAESDGTKDDGMKESTSSGLMWGNITTALRWNHIFTNQLFCNTTITYSRYRMTIYMQDEQSGGFSPENNYDISLEYLSGIQDWSGRMDFDFMPSPDHYIRFGGSATLHTFNPGAFGVKGLEIPANILTVPNIYTREYDLYGEDDYRITDLLKVNAGLHLSMFSVRGKSYPTLQPRLSARYLLTDDMSAKASFSRMAQYVHLLTNSGLGLPTDLWVPTTDNLRPQTSNQVAAGLAYNLLHEYELSAEAYYKTMDNVIEYKEGASFFNIGGGWEDKVLQGSGRSYGLELFAQKKTGDLTGWIGYTLSYTDRQFALLNQGRRFPYKYDRRHDLSIVLTQKIGKRVEVSGTWVFGTGNSITIPTAISYMSNPLDPSTQTKVYEYSDRNGYKMPPYHRLDLSVSFIRKMKHHERSWIIGAYNAYNRYNAYYIDLEEGQKYDEVTYKTITRYRYMQYSLFPIIPTVSYSFKF
jgi:outer membrane cobalamin receptor